MSAVAESAVLSGSDLSVLRGERQLFSGLSFAVNKGETLQLRGANGSGKTTLLRCIAGLTEADEGKVYFQGCELAKCRDDYGHSLTWYGHRHGLKEELSVRNNLEFYQAVGGHTAYDNIDSALQTLGIADLADLAVSQLSAGQKRRASLARLCLRQAKVWLLDEPFTNLDHSSAKTMATLIEKHCAAGGICVLAAHDLPADVQVSWNSLELERYAP